NDGTGLYYYRARYYSPVLQRFISEDPIAFAGGDTNLYMYVRGDPVNLRDSWGYKPGDTYSSRDAAGTDAIRDINPQSIAQDVEYAGRIYRNSDGTYSYTSPNKGTKDTSYSGSCPAGTSNAGDYHTHGANDPGYDNEHFSPQDKRVNNAEGVPGYLGTPS